MRRLEETEVVAEGDYCWNGEYKPEEYLSINPIASGMMASEITKLWPGHHVYTQRMIVFRRLEDNEILQTGDVYRGKRNTAIIAASILHPILNSMGMTAREVRIQYPGFDFFTTRRRNDLIFDKPFGLLKSLM